MSHRHHYVYRIDRPSTGEFYIGLRSSKLPPIEDPYMGSGTLLRRKMRNHRSQFFKTVLVQVESREEADRLEALLVTEELLLNPLCLNRQPGGFSGPAGQTRPEHVNWAIADTMRGRPDTEDQKRLKSEAAKAHWAAKKAEDPTYGMGRAHLPGGEEREVIEERVFCRKVAKLCDRWMASKYRHLGIKPNHEFDPYAPMAEFLPQDEL
tara:strand:- start:19088 stop:19711 length:624 start_codon:yes stop_codon:yes gene_type:complete